MRSTGRIGFSLAVLLAAALAAGCASRGGAAGPSAEPTDVRAYLRTLPPTERRQAELQIEALAGQQAAGFLMEQGVPLATVAIGPPTRTRDGWVYPVARRDDPERATAVRVYETSEVRVDNLTVLQPTAADLAAMPDRRFDPVRVERNTGAADPATGSPFGP